jgi:hypothetical protein
MIRSEEGRLRRAVPQSAPAAVGLVECLVRVTPALARRIRKAAELEAAGTATAAALLGAAGVPPGRIEGLETEIERLSGELARSQRDAEDRGVAIDRLRATLKERESELTQLRRTHGNAGQELAAARRELGAAETRRAADAETAAKLRAQLAAGVSLAKLDAASAGEVRKLVERLGEGGDFRSAALTAAGYDESEVADALGRSRRSELRAADELLARSGWRTTLLRWLLRS